MKRLLVGLSVVLTTLFATASHAADEQIRIIRGTLFQAVDIAGILNVDGTSGVRLDVTLDSSVSGLGWAYCDLSSSLCQPGEVLSLLASYGTSSGYIGSGQITIHGQTYILSNELQLRLRFDGAVVLPEFTDSGRAELSAPFAFSGSFQVPNRLEPDTYDVFELHRSGVATVTLFKHQYYEGWLAAVRYDFVPRIQTH